MALPNQFDPASPPDSQAPSLGDDRIRELKQAIIDIFGLPSATNVTAALFAAAADGITSANFRNAAAYPSTAGFLQRNATMLSFYDGSFAQRLNGTIAFNITQVGNVGTGTDDLMGFTLSDTSYFPVTSRCIEIAAFGLFGATANAKALHLAIGSTSTKLNSVTGSPNNKPWMFHGFLYKPSTANTQFCLGEFVMDPGSTEGMVNITATASDAAALTVKFTGAATDDNDIVQSFLMARLVN